MPSQSLRRPGILPFIATLLIGSLFMLEASAQTGQSKSDNAIHHKTPPNVYEDSEIRVAVPHSWRVVFSGGKDAGELLLAKDPYRLELKYHTSQASGIVGGRITEIFEIPWPNPVDVSDCMTHLAGYTYPAGRDLMFVSLTLDTADPKARKDCGILKPAGKWIKKDGKRQHDDGDRRWFGGYFTTKFAGYFFGKSQDGCGEKAYTLTSTAIKAEQLPVSSIPNQDSNPGLEKAIQEAIDIVDAVHYKKCSPF